TLQTEDEKCWLTRLTFVSNEAEANLVIYCKDGEIWCKTRGVVSEGECLCASITASCEVGPPAVPNHVMKVESAEPSSPPTLHSEIQLLPQQAGMAAILATAVVNKDIFPCKDCGIWFRSERNLQAHLMYYCASRQKSGSPAAEEKPKEVCPNERFCPFPQCNKSCPSASSLEIHMRSHSGERPFVCLICYSAFTTKANCERHLKVHTDTLKGVCHGCGFTSTTRDILYSHLVIDHMICQPGSKGEVYSPGSRLPAVPLASGFTPVSPTTSLKCALCGFTANTLVSLHQHTLVHTSKSPATGDQIHTQFQCGTEPSESSEIVRSPQQEAVDTKENGEAAAPSESSSLAHTIITVKIKEEPQQNHNSESENEDGEKNPDQQGQLNPANDPSSRTSSPRSLSSIKVKTEISSPTPGSSPVHYGSSSVGPGGAVFLPQYMFNHEPPQASEILAKMSELVHTRLKQGHNSVSSLYAGAPVQKGATCFECEITFNNINNYFVHKRLYCSGRHQQDDNPTSSRRAKAGPQAGTVASTNLQSSSSTTESQTVSGLHSDTEPNSSTNSIDTKVTEVKVEDNTTKDTSSEGENASRVSEGSQSPSNSVDEQDEDPTKTACEACNIRFIRHENYIVHKRYYCASRHDPPLDRPNACKAPFLPQPVRTRKRRKLYEIHGTAAIAQFGSAVSPVEPLNIKQEPSSVSRSDGTTALTSFIPTTNSSPDGEGPIDLSKKPRLHEGPLSPSVLPLTDYHECTACRISFNNVENYLAHKKYYCPATSLQQKTIEQLQKIKSPVPGLAKRTASATSESTKTSEPLEGRRVEKNIPVSPNSISPCTNAVSPTVTAAICPYCPLNGPITGDMIEHFRNVHGLFITKQTSTQTRPVGPSISESSLQTPRLPSKSPPQAGSRAQKDSFICKEQKEPTLVTSRNGSPIQTISPRPVLPVSPVVPLNISPVPDSLREAGLKPLSSPVFIDKSVQTPKGLSAPVQNGNSRYCRLCNIKFNSLSTFIAHKKYYCSSHAAEHVK
uniref:Zinc finger protein, FOG family member 1 n=1 Tax=Latimeria chalumnae TaxID=7897 RepID=H3BGB1_LATCH